MVSEDTNCKGSAILYPPIAGQNPCQEGFVVPNAVIYIYSILFYSVLVGCLMHKQCWSISIVCFQYLWS